MTPATLRNKSRDKSTARNLPAEVDTVAAAFPTALGWVAIAHCDAVVIGVVFGHASQRQAIDALRRNLGQQSASSSDIDVLEIDDQPRAIVGLIERLQAYAAGDDVDFSDVRIDERHLTEFGRRIVKACRRIPRGATRSYGELAAASGSPGAARAVGQAMAKNRYPLVVPCHRVLAAGGQIGGFSAPQGLTMKRRLLALEEAIAIHHARR
jgi:methylated-DNA-[protein]-cysteine S-methyltransferase